METHGAVQAKHPVALVVSILVLCALMLCFKLGVNTKPELIISGHTAQLKTKAIPLTYLDQLADKLKSRTNHSLACRAEFFGKDWGRHALCAHKMPQKPCYFYSFGISTDWSFDVDVAHKFGCFGFAADPTVSHPSLLHPKVTFHHLAATSLDQPSAWMFSTSIPGLRLWQKHDNIAVLKMDCEGCEYALARDVLAEDGQFFTHVSQFTVEVHYSKKWLSTEEALHGLAALLYLLQEAKLELILADITHCAHADEQTGLLPELVARGMRLEEGHCHNYLFARL